MSNSKKFKSPDGKDIRVSMLNGLCCTIGSEWREVPEGMWQVAYSLGAISGDMEGGSVEDKAAIKKAELEAEKKLLTAKITLVLKELFNKPDDNLDKNGNPLVRKISAIVGEPVAKAEMYAIWKELKETEG